MDYSEALIRIQQAKDKASQACRERRYVDAARLSWDIQEAARQLRGECEERFDPDTLEDLSVSPEYNSAGECRHRTPLALHCLGCEWADHSMFNAYRYGMDESKHPQPYPVPTQEEVEAFLLWVQAWEEMGVPG